MNSSSRDQILSRLKRTPPFAYDKADGNNTSEQIEQVKKETSRLESKEQLTQTFIDQAITNRIEVLTTTEQDWIKLVKKVLEEKNIARLMLGNTLPCHVQLTEQLKQSSDINPTVFDDKIESLRQELFDNTDAGFTLAQAAIAETGTLVLIPDQYQPRTLSLVPPIHIALLRENTITPDFPSLVNEHPDWPRKFMPSNVVLVSSPSKTADIQQTLAYGAHGPKELVVILVKTNNPNA